jgi:alpha-methylacyl-CoA racemase
VHEFLRGVRILDLTRLLPGAYATLVLSDLGAEVIKIEDPRGGDGMRNTPSRTVRAMGAPGEPERSTSLYFELLNRNKRSVTLDLRSPEAHPILDTLIATSDVLIESFRPSTARRLGVDASSLRARHPRLICASIAGFGASGPYAERAAHDINYQALAGLLKPPSRPGPLIGDIGAAMQTAAGVLGALFHRERTGRGSTVDVSIHEAALHWSMCPTTADLESACYTLYETADGEWLALGALETKFWVAFCERIERPDLVPLQHARGAERERVMRDVRAIVKTRTRAEWLARFDGADACLTSVYTRDDVVSDPHVVARGVVTGASGVTYVTAPGVRVRPAPALGVDTDDVLEAAGIGAAKRASLRQASVI